MTSAEARQELEQLLRVALLVEHVGAEDEIPGRAREQHGGLVPAHTFDAQGDAVARGVLAQQPDRVLRPVGGQDVAAGERGGERGQAEPGAELEHTLAVELESGDHARKVDAARPELGPVGQELVLVERALVDQLVGARRSQHDELAAAELELLLDQSGANRSTGTPSGSASCAYRWPQNASHGSFSPWKPASTTRA